MAIALPAVLTNLAAPVAGAFMNGVLAPFGDEAIAANAIITRLVPVAFGFVFALSAAVGPVISQNLGARNIVRVRRTLVDSLIVTAAAVVLAWVILALARNGISFIFHAKEETADLVSFFCLVIAGTWIFHGALLVANASFNNLGAPALATAFNWGKSTLGTIPFALVGVQMGGVKGALIGQGIGALLFGIGGVYAAFRVVAMIERRWTIEQK
jgi:Na+-driven multidrug efflux pump